MARRPGSWLVLVIVVAWCLLFEVGCRSKSSSRVLRLGYFPNLSHAQAVLGVSSGELAKELGETKLETKVFNAGPSLIEALLAGEIDVGYVGPGPALAGHEKAHGKAFRVVAGASANGVAIVAAKDSPINSLADLKGKRVATPQLGNTQDIAARHFAKASFGSVDAVKLVPIALAEQAAMLARGEIDAAWVPEPWAERLISENGARLVAEEKDSWPEKQFTLAVVIATNELISSRREEVVKVLAVHHRWTTRLRQDPNAHAPALGTALAALTGKKLPEGILPRALARVTFTDDPIPASIATMGSWTRDLGFAKQDADVASLVDGSLMPLAAK